MGVAACRDLAVSVCGRLVGRGTSPSGLGASAEWWAGFLSSVGPFTVVGALLAVRVPANPIGWIFLLVSLGLLLGQDASSYAVRAYRIDGHGLPLSRLAVAVATGWVSFALLPLPILLFPDGQVSGRGWQWRLRVYLAVAAMVVGAVGVHDLSASTDAQIHVDSSGELAAGARFRLREGSERVRVSDTRDHRGGVGCSTVAALARLDGRPAPAAQVADQRRRRLHRRLRDLDCSTAPIASRGMQLRRSHHSRSLRCRSRSASASSSTGCTRSTG